MKSLKWSLDSFETEGWTVHMTLCVFCVTWAVRDELPKSLISKSVLFLVLLLCMNDMLVACKFC